jgi:phosphatidate cytidylyltransferase
VLRYRLITGPLLILVLLGVIMVDNHLDELKLSGFWSSLFGGRATLPRGIPLFLLGLVVACPLAAIELADIARAQGISTRGWLSALAAMVGLTISYSTPWDTPTSTAIAIVSTGMIGMFVMSLLTFSKNRNVQGVMASAGSVIFAMVYIGLMLGFLLAIRRSHSGWWIVGIIMTTKACDIGAYFTGRAIGRRKMIPWLSPGKTWEGLGGGIVAAALVGMLMAGLSRLLESPADHVSLPLGAMCGVVFAVIGQFGDLTMSLFKRGAGLKDSSGLLPGMGGILDVLDSPLMVAPVAYWMLAA